jgi:hypothetical protein
MGVGYVGGRATADCARAAAREAGGESARQGCSWRREREAGQQPAAGARGRGGMQWKKRIRRKENAREAGGGRRG